VADRGHAKADQVVGRQLGQYFSVDIVVAERRGVALKAQALQSCRCVHALILGCE
jgi:hypothetical protein